MKLSDKLNSKVKLLYKPTTSCDYHRLYLPFSKLGYDFTEKRTVDECELIVFNRLPTFSNEIFFFKQKQIGFKYIVDLDDSPFLNKEHYLYNIYNNKKTTDKIIEVVKNADAVIVTTDTLADVILPYNKNIFVISNAIPVDDEQFKRSGSSNSKFSRFIYAGGASHYNDVKLISGVVNKTNIDFTLAGFSDKNEEIIKTRALLSNNINLINNKPFNEYMSVYDYMDVSLVPLVNNSFNICKSNLKVLEAGIKGLSVICSKTLPYYNDIDKNIIDFAENKNDWIRLIKQYDNKSYANYRGQLLFEHIKQNYNLENINQKRIELLEQFV